MNANLYDPIPGAPNFYRMELVRSATAIRHGIPNMPNERQLQAIDYTARTALQPVRNEFGRINVTSGFTCKELCPFIPRGIDSNHARGEAGDIEPDDPRIPLWDIGEFIAENLKFRELIFEWLPWGWIHVAARRGGNIGKIKIKDRNHNYTVVSLDYARRLYGRTSG